MPRFLGLILSALLCLWPIAAAAQTFPPLTGRVVDAAGLIDPAREQALADKLAGIEKASGRQLVVATLPDLQGYDIADYGYRLGRAWGIGAKDKNDGALLIVAPQERRVRIEVGYGMEPVLTDVASALIINDTITPRFKQGDYAGGIDAGVDAIGALMKLTPEEAKARADALAERHRRQESRDGFIHMAIVPGIFLLFFVLPMLFGRRRGRRYRRSGLPIVLWGPGLGGGSWGGGGGFGSGSGGGFSGGGGSFGGGGASGSW